MVDSISNWVSIVGKWTYGNSGDATYNTPQQGQRPFGICVSDTRFSEGEISFQFSQTAGEIDGRILLGYRSMIDGYYIVGLGGYGKAFTLARFTLTEGWRLLAGVGAASDLVLGRKYSVSVKVEGTRIRLKVDQVQVIDSQLLDQLPLGQIGLFAWGETGTASFSNVCVSRASKDVERVVVLVHGIRTFAEWQSMLRNEFSRVGIPVVPTNFGYFDALRFLMPGSLFRERALRRLKIVVDQAQAKYPNAEISFIAHSFGSYLVSRLLQDEFNFKAGRIVFCGSVIPADFPFEQIQNRFSAPVLNEVSARDPWPLIAQRITWGYGSVGTRGFNVPSVVDRWHKGFAHSQYLQQSFCSKYWLPFFSEGIIIESQTIASPPAWWIRVAALVCSKYFILSMAVLLSFLWPYFWVGERTPTANQRACYEIRASDSAEWRSQNLLPDKTDRFYVIVASVTDYREYKSLNKIAAQLKVYKLRRQFPTIDFDVMLTSNLSGGNRMHAIVLARGLEDGKRACQLRLLARTCGVASDAYVYQLGVGPQICELAP